MIAYTIMAAVASAQPVTVTDEPLSIGARVDCVITKSDPRVRIRSVTFLFLDQRQDTGKPIVLVLETDASGSSVLYRRTASSIPPPPDSARSNVGPPMPPVFRPVILIDNTPMETLAPATNRGDRWMYDKTTWNIVTDGGGSYALKSSGRCDLRHPEKGEAQ